jgi:molybdopterin-guanine dinucleotide biosynthesis protein A
VTVAAIVLAGGRGRRFGGDKLATEVDGRSLLARAVEATAEVADLVVVALAWSPTDTIPTGDLAIPAGTRLVLVHDPRRDGGPLLGAATALETTQRLGADHAILVGGDMPWLRRIVLDALLAALDDPAVDACTPVVDGASRPLPASLRVGPALGAARAGTAANRRSLMALFDGLRTAELTEAAWRVLDPAGESFRDVDHPADLDEAPRSTR